MNIEPSTTIRQNYNGFSKYCHELDEPVIITRNGKADLVVMSHEAFRRMEARVKLQSKLLVAEKQIAEDTFRTGDSTANSRLFNGWSNSSPSTKRIYYSLAGTEFRP